MNKKCASKLKFYSLYNSVLSNDYVKIKNIVANQIKLDL